MLLLTLEKITIHTEITIQPNCALGHNCDVPFITHNYVIKCFVIITYFAWRRYYVFYGTIAFITEMNHASFLFFIVTYCLNSHNYNIPCFIALIYFDYVRILLDFVVLELRVFCSSLWNILHYVTSLFRFTYITLYCINYHIQLLYSVFW